MKIDVDFFTQEVGLFLDYPFIQRLFSVLGLILFFA